MESLYASYVTLHRSRASTHNRTLLCGTFSSFSSNNNPKRQVGLFSGLVFIPFEKRQESFKLLYGKVPELKLLRR